MKIINRETNFRKDTCYKIMSKGKICSLSKNEVLKISSPFEELRNEEKDICDTKDLGRANERVKEKHLAKIRILKKEQNGGYILVSSLTCIGTLIVGTIIFMTIKLIVFK